MLKVSQFYSLLMVSTRLVVTLFKEFLRGFRLNIISKMCMSVMCVDLMLARGGTDASAETHHMMALMIMA